MTLSARRVGLRWTLVASGVAAFVIVPFVLVGPPLEGWAANLVDQFGRQRFLVAVIIAFLLAADVFLPVPSSIVSTAAGALLGFALGSVVSLFGMTCGCVLGYWLGRTGGRTAARTVVGDAELARLAAAARRHGTWVLVTTRAVPVLAESATIFAGMSAMPAARFFPVVILASAGVSVAYAAFGAFAVQAGSFLLAFGGSTLIPLAAMTVAKRTDGRLVNRAETATAPAESPDSQSSDER